MTPQETLNQTKAMEKAMVKINTMEVVAGITKESATKFIYGEVDENAPTVLEVGSAHEFGIGVPERSFLRATWINKEKEINKIKKNAFLQMTDLSMSVEDGHEFLGVALKDFAKEAFNDGGFGEWKALSAETIAKKGTDKILVQTNTLKNSMDHEVRKANNAA